MLLKSNGIFDLDSWEKLAPPMGGDTQWKDGRSAKELARYMMSYYPNVPKEIEDTLSNFVSSSSEFEWSAEYVTDFQSFNLGRGEGRNHDAFMFNSDIVVGIEGKADEALGSQLIGDAIKTASENKMQRINGMIQMLFGDAPSNHTSLRYQLVTASVATMLEATKNNVSKALLLIIVFKKQGYYSETKIEKNKADISNFLIDTSAQKCGDYYVIPTKYGEQNGINLYFKQIEILL